MTIRRKKLAGKGRRDLYRQFAGDMEQGQSAIGNALARASNDLQHSIQQARVTVAEAEKSMAQGTRDFQEVTEQCRTATTSATDAAASSSRNAEAGANDAIQAMMRGLQRLSDSFAKAAEVSGQTGSTAAG